MEGRGVKYERAYLKAYNRVSAARAAIADYFDWYKHGKVRLIQFYKY